MNGSELVALGEISNAQGVTGEVRVIPFTHFPERFQRLDRVFAGSGECWQPLHVKGVRPHRQFLLIRFAEINDRNAAEGLKGMLLAVPPDERWPLPEGHFYVDDLMGMVVCDENGKRLGTIRDVLETGANSVLVVQESKEELLIPMLKTVIREVDLSGRVMRVQLPLGLLEEPGDAD